MKSFQQFLTFAVSAKHLSFASAARELGLEASTVAKSVGRLESGLGIKLFYRTTRNMTLTPDGEALYSRCLRILEEVEELEMSAAATRNLPSGTLKINAPVVYGRQKLFPIMTELLASFPMINADIRLSDTLVDLIADGYDAVIRIGALSDSRLVARQIDEQQLILCASVSYLEKYGVPDEVDALDRHQCLVFRSPTSGRYRPWQFLVKGKPIEIHPDTRWSIDDGEAIVEAVRSGAGIAQLPNYMIAGTLSDGSITEIMQEYRSRPIPINIVTPSGKMMPPRVRCFIDAMLQHSNQ